MDEDNINILYLYIEKGKAAKTHFFTKSEFPVIRIDMKKERTLTCCQIPEYYIGKRTWEREKLMKHLNVLLAGQEYEDYYLQPELAAKLDIREKLPPECLMHSMFRQIPCLEYLFYIGGRSEMDEWSGEYFRGAELWEEKQRMKELLEPYFSRMNHVNLVTDEPQAYEDFIEYIYEEYGIPTACAHRLEKRWGREGKTVILDGRRDYKIPWTEIPEGACYVDFWSVEEKRTYLGKMRRDVRYMSVVKFLDTLVKNGYNTIVN